MGKDLEKRCSIIEEKSSHPLTVMIDDDQIVVYPDELDDEVGITDDVFEDIVEVCNDELLVLDESKSDKSSYLYFKKSSNS